jgi:hypothetical protein
VLFLKKSSGSGACVLGGPTTKQGDLGTLPTELAVMADSNAEGLPFKSRS